MCKLEFYDDYARSAAEQILSDHFVYSEYHDVWLHRDHATYSEIDDLSYPDDDCEVTYCEQCHENFHREVNSDRQTDDDGNDYCCQDCAENAGLYLHDDGVYRERPESGLLEYHSCTRYKYPASADRPFRIGFEVEKEDSECRADLEMGHRLADEWVAEEDSSLDGDTGFELVSPAYNLADSERIESDLDSMSRFLDADSSVDCGGHITISDHRMTGYQMADENPGLFPLLMALYPARLRSSYVKSGKLEKLLESSEKYRPFRINANTIELRIIARVTSTKCLKWRYRLLKWMLENQPTLAETRESLRQGWLREHLLQVYSEDRLRDKQALFDAFAEYFYDVSTSGLDRIQEYLTEQVS